MFPSKQRGERIRFDGVKFCQRKSRQHPVTTFLTLHLHRLCSANFLPRPDTNLSSEMFPLADNAQQDGPLS